MQGSNRSWRRSKYLVQDSGKIVSGFRRSRVGNPQPHVCHSEYGINGNFSLVWISIFHHKFYITTAKTNTHLIFGSTSSPKTSTCLDVQLVHVTSDIPIAICGFSKMPWILELGTNTHYLTQCCCASSSVSRSSLLICLSSSSLTFDQ